MLAMLTFVTGDWAGDARELLYSEATANDPYCQYLTGPYFTVLWFLGVTLMMNIVVVSFCERFIGNSSEGPTGEEDPLVEDIVSSMVLP